MREWIDNHMAKSKGHAKMEHMIRDRAPKLAKREHERRERLDKIAGIRAKLYAH